MTFPPAAAAPAHLFPRAGFNLFVIGLTAFLTVVDLFATQAILPALAERYGATPAQMGAAVSASTAGMAVAGLLVALFSARIPRRAGIVLSLAVLAVPTALLASAPDLMSFAALRIWQGLCMSAAFTLTLAHLGERCTASASPAAFAAYVTGNVASNLIGRMLAAGLAEGLGLDANFFIFAALNLAGAVLVAVTLSDAPAKPELMAPVRPALTVIREQLANARLRAAFAVGFFILFAFIGAFSYVNFVLVAPPYGLGMIALGCVYTVFIAALFTTPWAGAAARRFGAGPTICVALLVSAGGLGLTLLPSLAALLAGLTVLGAGTFFAQAAATGFVSRVAGQAKGPASGLYLAAYYLGGLAGAQVLGQTYMAFGWTGCAIVAGLALITGALTGATLQEKDHGQANT